MTWTQETGNKEFQVKNWHLKKNDGKKIGSQKNPEKLASQNNDSQPRNGKQKIPIEKLAPKKNDCDQKFGSKKVNKKSDTLNK